VDYEAFCGIGAPPVDAEISVADLARTRAAGGLVTLLDVREPFEWELVHLPGSVHIPLRDLPARVRELDSRGDLVVLCHHGQRSLVAVDFLRGAGFSHARSLAGGIDAWAAEADPSLPRY
jgi:rhodanese-related sulfurtransferase